MFFHQVALVFALQVGAPVYGELELAARLLENLHTLGVSEAYEVVVNHKFEAFDEFFVEVSGQEFDVVLAVFEGILHAVLYELLSQVHVVADFIESHFRLNHPEFRQVTRSIGIFGAECGAEGVYCAKGCCSELAFELAAYGKRSGLAEEVLAVVHLAVVGVWQVVQRQGCYLEHGSGTFAVAGGDERCVKIEKAFFVEELMNGKSQS